MRTCLMRDSVDRANNLAQSEIDSLVAKRKVYTGKSALYCCQCNDPIPEARRDAIPGVSLCVDCQHEDELRARHGL